MIHRITNDCERQYMRQLRIALKHFNAGVGDGCCGYVGALTEAADVSTVSPVLPARRDGHLPSTPRPTEDSANAQLSTSEGPCPVRLCQVGRNINETYIEPIQRSRVAKRLIAKNQLRNGSPDVTCPCMQLSPRSQARDKLLPNESSEPSGDDLAGWMMRELILGGACHQPFALGRDI